jgi:hypothetical protein
MHTKMHNNTNQDRYPSPVHQKLNYMDKHKYNVVQEEQEEESEKNMATVNKNKNNNYDNSLYANIGHKHK